MIIVEEVAIEGTCRQMSIKLVDSCYGILRDPLMLHQSSSACQLVEFLYINIHTLQKAAIILPATTAVLQSAILRNTNVTFSLWKAPTKNSFHTLRIYFQNLCKTKSLNNSIDVKIWELYTLHYTSRTRSKYIKHNDNHSCDGHCALPKISPLQIL